MNNLNYPFATQDWNLGKGSTLTLQASQLKSVEALTGSFWVTVNGNSQDFFLANLDRIDLTNARGNVVVEALVDNATLRLRQCGDERIVAPSNSLGRALQVSLLAPASNGLRSLANWLDPLPHGAR